MTQQVPEGFVDALGEANSASPDKLAKMRELAEEAGQLERSIVELEEAVKAQKERARQIKEGQLTEIMLELGIPTFETEDGIEFKLHNYMSGSLPKEPEARASAIDYVEEQGGEAIIKNVITITFEKSQHNEAMHVAQTIREMGYACEVEPSIHAGTLQKFGREKLAAGEDFDMERVGLNSGRVVKVKLP